MKNYIKIEKINFKNSIIYLDGLNLEEVLACLNIDKENIKYTIEGNTLFVLEKTGTKY